MEGRNIFITGGAGYLGKNLVQRWYADNKITIYSRDEAKHYYLKKQFPKINCVVGDVRNFDLLKRSSAGHDIGVFAASLKQIEAVDQNVSEATEIIINGAINSRRCAEENGMEAACFISSDKSRAATTLYGAMKFVAGESFIVNSVESRTRLSSAIYGNVTNSTGSIIPLIWDSINKGYSLTLYSEDMTRFMIDINEAIDLVEFSLTVREVNVIPFLRSFKVFDLFEIFREDFGLKYIKGEPRVSEKLHEMMIAPEEIPRTRFLPDEKLFLMHYKNLSEYDLSWLGNSFPSNVPGLLMSREELRDYLKTNNYFS